MSPFIAYSSQYPRNFIVVVVFFEKSIKMGPSVMRRYVHILERAVPTLYKYIGRIL